MARSQSPARPQKLSPEASERVLQQVKLMEAELRAKLYAMDPKAHPADGAPDIIDIYRKAAVDGELVYKIIISALTEFYGMRVNAKSAVQVSQAVDESSVKLLFLQSAQNQVLIEQNKKIIRLLEQMTTARK